MHLVPGLKSKLCLTAEQDSCPAALEVERKLGA
jgi:hypothetical protein